MVQSFSLPASDSVSDIEAEELVEFKDAVEELRTWPLIAGELNDAGAEEVFVDVSNYDPVSGHNPIQGHTHFTLESYFKYPHSRQGSCLLASGCRAHVLTNVHAHRCETESLRGEKHELLQHRDSVCRVSCLSTDMSGLGLITGREQRTITDEIGDDSRTGNIEIRNKNKMLVVYLISMVARIVSAGVTHVYSLENIPNCHGEMLAQLSPEQPYDNKYFNSHPPVYEKYTNIFVWNCALHSASDVVFDCCAHAHIGASRSLLSRPGVLVVVGSIESVAGSTAVCVRVMGSLLPFCYRLTPATLTNQPSKGCSGSLCGRLVATSSSKDDSSVSITSDTRMDRAGRHCTLNNCLETKEDLTSQPDQLRTPQIRTILRMSDDQIPVCVNMPALLCPSDIGQQSRFNPTATRRSPSLATSHHNQCVIFYILVSRYSLATSHHNQCVLFYILVSRSSLATSHHNQCVLFYILVSRSSLATSHHNQCVLFYILVSRSSLATSHHNQCAIFYILVSRSPSLATSHHNQCAIFYILVSRSPSLATYQA
uniref:(California timema) hypothetical protein n=1 Tax=Timema californicum TaxID=61474 RepID=A0A7R9J337_TIMCA|nr:unnamed protein product [Timema californicum]